jgi:serine/threonine protein kinase
VPRIEELLQQLNRGTRSLVEVRVELARLAQSPGQEPQYLVVRIQDAVTSGQLDRESARALLETIANASDATELPGDATLTDRTLAMDAEKTLLQDADRTFRPPERSAATALRPASPAQTSQAGTLMRSAHADDEVTLRKPASAMGADSTEIMPLSPTLEANAHAPRFDTAARTLRSPASQPDDPAYMRTLQAVQKSQIPDPMPDLRAAAPVAAHHGELRPGTVIKHRFLLDSLIGKGGMGLVFAAIDRRKEEARDPNPRVALKVLNADFKKHAQSFIALQREALKAQTLAHPNVVTVFDFDRDGDAVFMTMELLKGRSLEAIVREARGKGISRERALPIIRGIAEGLAYAHRKGIVHSDLKPGNVFITSDDTPKILDFGIARAVPNVSGAEAPDVFDAGSFGAYTEAYATNEMVNGIAPHPADDMYALGIIGYELLTGFHPFQRYSAPSARKLRLQPVPLKGVKRREARALERCLSFDRKDRPKDATEFLRLFRGVSTLQKATLAATAVLAIASGYLSYQNYLENSPGVPFSKLPADTRQQLVELLRQGDEEWAFYVREKNVAALQSAVEQYARAYALHPRNRDAVRGLRRAADALLQGVKGREEQREIAGFLQGQSDYFRKYQPVIDAAD